MDWYGIWKKKVTGSKSDFNLAIGYVESLVALSVVGFYKHPVAVKNKLDRALKVASSINNSVLIGKVKDAILQLEDRIAEDDKPGLWGFSYDYLVGNRKVNLSPAEENNIIQELEGRLERLTNVGNADPHSAEGAAVRLAKYYQGQSKPEDVKRVMLKLGEAIEHSLDGAGGLKNASMLEHLHRLYIHYNLREEAKVVLIKLRNLGGSPETEFTKLSHEYSIPTEEVERFVNWILGDNVKDAMSKIAGYFSPDKEKSQQQVLDLAKKYPLTFLMPEKIVDAKGRSIAEIGALEDDLDGRVVRQISNGMAFSSFLLHMSLMKFIERYFVTAKMFVEDFMKKSPAFDGGKFSLIERGIEAYLSNDYVVFIHIAIPQIEEAFRTIVEKMGGLVLKPAKGGGGFHLKTFDEILRDDSINQVYGDDFSLYSRILFTDQRGWNVRNDLCHGMMPEDNFGQMTADRIFHVLICLSLIEYTSD